MHYISIQIQPESVADFDQQKFLAQLKTVARSPEIDQFSERGKTFLHYNFFTEKPKMLWQDLQNALYQHPHYSAVIKPISIAVYENESQPDTFLLLHHYDTAEKTDQL